jgi:hypothetical protein
VNVARRQLALQIHRRITTEKAGPGKAKLPFVVWLLKTFPVCVRFRRGLSELGRGRKRFRLGAVVDRDPALDRTRRRARFPERCGKI